jgi:hypothetical protein
MYLYSNVSSSPYVMVSSRSLSADVTISSRTLSADVTITSRTLSADVMISSRTLSADFSYKLRFSLKCCWSFSWKEYRSQRCLICSWIVFLLLLRTIGYFLYRITTVFIDKRRFKISSLLS